MAALQTYICVDVATEVRDTPNDQAADLTCDRTVGHEFCVLAMVKRYVLAGNWSEPARGRRSCKFTSELFVMTQSRTFWEHGCNDGCN